ncbi:ATP-binding protein [Albidovulum aquaemixtae]|nr:ATP-binding protein [Defluviimonas aquaemixtae]
MAERILKGYVEPRMTELEHAFSALRREVEHALDEHLERGIYTRSASTQADQQGFLSRIFAKKARAPVEKTLPEIEAISEWQEVLAKPALPFERACLEGLHTIVAGIVGQRGRLMGDKSMVNRLATNWICNSYGSQKIGEMIEPIIREAVTAEGYRFLPFQTAPFVLNVKGASAAGKSTIRPLQRKLAERLGLPWEDFALVSPDYWRKFLLDYDSLGDGFKYAAMLTGQELEIIDKKLDGYMEAKAMRSEMPHLLIDRFRFDSFESVAKQQADGRLLSRFGDTVFMFFVITPPAETVERAWKRGLETGRYKAVDDLLYHNIEAYTGMPNLFFTWVKKERQTVHFEFLDNSVPYGQPPRTAAFGWNDKLTVLDVDCMRSLTRYRSVNIDAKGPDEVLMETDEAKSDILADCIEKITDVTFLDQRTLEVLGHTRDGKCDYEVDGFFAKNSLPCAHVSPTAGGDGDEDSARLGGTKLELDAERERKFTVGAWGGE